MLHYIKGKVTGYFENGIVLENNGIGYEINVPALSMDYIREKNEDILIYTVMMVREDDISLYGFASKDDISIFKKLLTVNGVGAKAALAVMSTFSTNTLKKIIAFEDDNSLMKAPGIGKKTAQRIVLELKDKMGEIGGFEEKYNIAVKPGITEEAIEALTGLGYSRNEAHEAVSKVANEGDSVEKIIKSALMNLSRK
ncbi:MAG: Holliday junction branch migration protein RuvA [Clostridiales bacterium]|nr:Holliday junction branch migration protein RuvA [Clostridiales bacterium]